jgi:hypothetical protein
MLKQGGMNVGSQRAGTTLWSAIAISVLVLSSAVILAQTRGGEASAPTSAASTYVPPRTPDGQPDISGMYEPGWINQPMETPSSGKFWKPPTLKGAAGIGPTDFGAREAAEQDLPYLKKVRTPMIIDPPDGKVPLLAWAEAKRKEIIDNQNKAQYLDGRVRCLQAGVPRANTPVYYNSYQILQKPGSVVIVYEWNHMTRIIPLDGRPHLDKKIRLPMGDSRGRWEGNTLVVDVTNFNDDTWTLGHGGPGEGQPYDTLTTGHGVVHSPDLHVVERFTPMNEHVIRYEARIEDPKTFSRPFTIALDAFVRGKADHQIFEYACHEGNRDGIFMATGVDIDPDQKNDQKKK